MLLWFKCMSEQGKKCTPTSQRYSGDAIYKIDSVAPGETKTLDYTFASSMKEPF